ncbi:MAG: aminoglycoside phosphotransferase family protein [Chloroflexi bacterium]|nr:aminoglycoside phosphotransferase family protein [Chloroflexota bacterium]
MIKPTVDIDWLTELLRDQFGQSPANLAAIESGLIASVFSFEIDGKGFVIRIATAQHAESLKKDQFIAGMLSPTAIPVPIVLHTGTMDDLHFAIAPKLPGVQLDQLPRQEYLNLVPAMIENLDDIRLVDVNSTQKYGYFDGEGVGPSESWPEYLLGIKDEQPEGTYYGKWHHLFNETFMDREFFDHVHNRMAALMEFCPSDRYLVHSDYGWDNVLAQDGKITAVLDWANALLGDFLYDVAWMDIYSPELDLRTQFKEHFRLHGVQVDNYEQRILAYQLHISLESQMFCSMMDGLDNYKWICDRTNYLLERG